jgi:hypothetical protein
MFYASVVLNLAGTAHEPALIVNWLSHKGGVAMFLSALELRNIIENSFLPKRCQCSLSPDLLMTIKVYADDKTDLLDLHVTGIDAKGLNGCREINELIAGLRTKKHSELFSPHRASAL